MSPVRSSLALLDLRYIQTISLWAIHLRSNLVILRTLANRGYRDRTPPMILDETK